MTTGKWLPRSYPTGAPGAITFSFPGIQVSTTDGTPSFYDRFGDKLVDELVGLLNDVDATFKAELREQNDRNLALFDAKLEQRLAELKAELIKWMFLFWLGTVATMLGLGRLLLGI